MNRWGTDVVAVACILGGAALGGAVAMTALARTNADPCAAPDVAVRTIVVGAGAKDHLVTVTPSVRVGGRKGCATVILSDVASGVRADRVDKVRLRYDVLRAQAEKVRTQADQMRAQAEALRAQAEATRAQADATTPHE